MKLYKMAGQDDLSAILHPNIYKLMLHQMSGIQSVESHPLPVEALAEALRTFYVKMIVEGC